MWFGFYLFDRGLISGDEFLAALRKRFRSHTPIGRLASETGKLTPQQIYELLLKQVNDARPLGEIAVAEGFLGRSDVADLLLEQSEQAISLPEAFVELGVFTTGEVEAHQSAGHRAMAERAQDEVAMATAT